MALALSRIRPGSDPLRGPVQRPPGKTLRLNLAGWLKAEHLRLYLGAGLAIGLIGIGVNALLFQHERHPAPLFASPPPASSASRAQAPPPAPKPASAEHETSAAPSPAALPPARPGDAAEASSPASDPITDLLRGEARGDDAHLIIGAQTALAKLGYPVKADGNDGLATQQALRDYERTHGLPPSTEITPRLVKQLTAAARSVGR